MFAIFGFQRKPHLLATIRAMCAGCQDRVTQELFSVRTRLPLPSRFRTTCAACGNSVTVSAEKADQLLASAPRVGDRASSGDLLAKGPAAA